MSKPIETLIERVNGEWTGSKTLYLSWLPNPEHRSDSVLSVKPVAMGKFLELSYTWQHEDKDHAGLLLVGANEGAATAAWVDSWHQSSGVLPLTGTIGADGTVELLGSYPAPPGPDWGWRIVLAPQPEHEPGLLLTMYNISPTGESELAVRLASHARA